MNGLHFNKAAYLLTYLTFCWRADVKAGLSGEGAASLGQPTWCRAVLRKQSPHPGDYSRPCFYSGGGQWWLREGAGDPVTVGGGGGSGGITVVIVSAREDGL